MKKGLVVIVTCMIGLIAVLSKMYRDTYTFKRREVTFYSKKLPKNENLTILQISDLHNRVFGSDNGRLINIVADSNPDIIVLTGDLIDRRTETFAHVFSLVERLAAIHPNIYFVTGNHEWGNPATSTFLDGLRERHVTILDNRNVKITKNGVNLNLAGVADASTKYANLEDAFRQLDTSHYTVLLSHTPGITEMDEQIPADLILSGHTHGGQVRFPLIGALVSPDRGLFPKLDKGTYRLGPDRSLYIDSGLGTTRLPIRFLNQSQLSLITITGTCDRYS
ncbi:metallophosphoesterase [Lentibacillus lipolyticus]|nr:metallophosphoesterase [Lentibacillus lipolyticus]